MRPPRQRDPAGSPTRASSAGNRVPPLARGNEADGCAADRRRSAPTVARGLKRGERGPGRPSGCAAGAARSRAPRSATSPRRQSGCCRRPARSAAGCSGQASSCPIPMRRRAPASRPETRQIDAVERRKRRLAGRTCGARSTSRSALAVMAGCGMRTEKSADRSPEAAARPGVSRSSRVASSAFV